MLRSSEEWEVFLGARVKKARLEMNLTQKEVASRCGLSVLTVANLEAGRGSTLATFVKVLKVLGLDGNLELLLPDAPISPIQLKQRKSERKRASSSGRGGRKA